MSDANSANQVEKAAKIRRKPERESVLSPTFGAVRQTSPDRHQGQPSGSGLLQRQCSCGKHTIAGGVCEECQQKGEAASQHAPDKLSEASTPDIQASRNHASGFDLSSVPAHTLTTSTQQTVQANLTVNEPGDQYEQEADRVAEAVMRMPASPLSSPFTGIDSFLQPTVSRLPSISRIQTSGGNGAFQAPAHVEARINQMKGSGQALPDTERDFFEERMGHDFSNVRVHTDSNAVQASRDIQAQAFTMGNNIAFNEGAYQPGTQAGRYLLAHELTHVVQQGAAGAQRKSAISQILGKRPESRVLSHLQALQQQPNFDASLYRKELAGFQRANSGDKIIAKQQQLLEGPEVNIRERDRSQTLRRCGTPSTPAKKKAGVDSFKVTWKKNSSAGPKTAALRLDYYAKFKKDANHDPALAEFRQNVKSVFKITAGTNKGFKDINTSMKDDNYSRADDLNGNSINDVNFYSNDNPGAHGWLAADDVIDYSFTAEQMIIDTSQGNKVIAKRGPHTATVKGKDPRAYGNVPKTFT